MSAEPRLGVRQARLRPFPLSLSASRRVLRGQQRRDRLVDVLRREHAADPVVQRPGCSPSADGEPAQVIPARVYEPCSGSRRSSARTPHTGTAHATDTDRSRRSCAVPASRSPAYRRSPQPPQDLRLNERVSGSHVVRIEKHLMLRPATKIPSWFRPATAECVNSFDPRDVSRTIGYQFNNTMRVTFGAKEPPVLYTEIPSTPINGAPIRPVGMTSTPTRLRTPGHQLGSRVARRRDLRSAVPDNPRPRR